MGGVPGRLVPVFPFRHIPVSFSNLRIWFGTSLRSGLSALRFPKYSILSNGWNTCNLVCKGVESFEICLIDGVGFFGRTFHFLLVAVVWYGVCGMGFVIVIFVLV